MLKAGFPLSSNTIEQFFASLKLDPLRLSRSSYSMEEFLSDVVGSDEQIIVAHVYKRRSKYQLDGCEAEYATVKIAVHPLQTVAVESSDSEAALSITDLLGVHSKPNIGYARKIKTVLTT